MKVQAVPLFDPQPSLKCKNHQESPIIISANQNGKNLSIKFLLVVIMKLLLLTSCLVLKIKSLYESIRKQEPFNVVNNLVNFGFFRINGSYLS